MAIYRGRDILPFSQAHTCTLTHMYILQHAPYVWTHQNNKITNYGCWSFIHVFVHMYVFPPPLFTYFKVLLLVHTYFGICFPASSLFHHDLSSFTLIWLLVAWWASKAEREIVEASKATLSELSAGWEGGRLSQSLSCWEANLVTSDMMTGVPRLHGRWTGLGEQVEPDDGVHLILLAEPWDPKLEDG